MNAFVEACNAQGIGNIAAHSGVLASPYTMVVWPNNGRGSSRSHYKNYGHAAKAFKDLDMENVGKVHIYDNIRRCLVKRK